MHTYQKCDSKYEISEPSRLENREDSTHDELKSDLDECESPDTASRVI